jgi:hypothetical protein
MDIVQTQDRVVKAVRLAAPTEATEATVNPAGGP